MDRIDAARTVDGQAAIFLRYGPAGSVVVAAVGGERTIEHATWLKLPLWTPPTQKTDPSWIEY
jgi:hypothetical protein